MWIVKFAWKWGDSSHAHCAGVLAKLVKSLRKKVRWLNATLIFCIKITNLAMQLILRHLLLRCKSVSNYRLMKWGRNRRVSATIRHFITFFMLLLIYLLIQNPISSLLRAPMFLLVHGLFKGIHKELFNSFSEH